MKQYIKMIIIANIVICTALAVSYCLIIYGTDKQNTEVAGSVS